MLVNEISLSICLKYEGNQIHTFLGCPPQKRVQNAGHFFKIVHIQTYLKVQHSLVYYIQSNFIVFMQAVML